MSCFTDVVGDFFVKVGRRVEVPLQIITEHLLVTIASLFSIWVIELVLKILGLGKNPFRLPRFHFISYCFYWRLFLQPGL